MYMYVPYIDPKSNLDPNNCVMLNFIFLILYDFLSMIFLRMKRTFNNE